ncbi:hypothetical protein MANES_03G091188v8 [Manihot esculenta]|uniref:Uncharacterized protein n=2 Tax=Manihot esculenta TaxID=3983 RepID=A0A2C9VRH5_MANES|nr:hypothetical protein MANES_03G091188v8 [Manihot esculenta]
MALLGSSFLPKQTMLHMPNKVLKPFERKSSVNITYCDRSKEKPPSGSGSQHNKILRIHQSQRRVEFTQELLCSDNRSNAFEDDKKTQGLDASISLMIH